MPEATPEAGRADDLLCAVELRGDPEAADASRRLERLVPRPAGRVRRPEPPPQDAGALAGWKGVVGAEAAAGEERARQVEGAALGLASPDGDDRGAGRER